MFAFVTEGRGLTVSSFSVSGDGNPNLFKKTSWVHSDDPRTISYTISVNQLKENMKEVTVEDNLQFTNASYVKDSFRVTKGEMSYVDGEWQFNNTKDVTNEHPVTVGENGQSFVVNRHFNRNFSLLRVLLEVDTGIEEKRSLSI